MTRLKHHFYVIIATFFYSGLIKPAPGTWGSFAAVWFSLAILSITEPLTLGVIALLSFIIGLPATRYYGKITGIIDNGKIVIDEAVAIMLIFACRDFFPDLNLLTFTVASFVYFRLFDITKPPPISFFDKNMKNAFGVMFDDILAVVYSLAGLQLTQWGLKLNEHYT